MIKKPLTILQKAVLNCQLHEVFKILEYRRGCVYKTRSLGYVVVAKEEECRIKAIPNITFASPSTFITKKIMEIA